VTTEERQLSLFEGLADSRNSLDYSVRKSARAKHLSIKVFPGGRVEVLVPRRTGSRRVRAFVDEHRDWIERSRRELAEVAPPEPFRLPEMVDLPGIEQRYGVRYERPSGGKSVHFRSRDRVVVLRGRTDSNALCVAALKRWLASVARRELEPRLRALSVRTGQPYEKLHIRGQRTRWGSYSSNGTVSLNFCLLFLDPEVLRYLIVHELCHARQMNHSRRFWRLVERHEPDYRRLDQALASSWSRVPAWLGMR
jgi:predicted metal-dependent hydrolase